MNTISSGNRPYVLFVDDEEMTRKTFERIVSREFRVLLASSVADAKRVLEQKGEEIGVLLTDQRMPGGLGVELLEYARDQFPAIVRMLTTAYSELEDAIAAVNRGEIIRYIEKPWNNIDALLIDLRVAMRFHELERTNNELLEEKFSAKARGARIERLQVLAALAAIQPDSNLALRSLEQMLKDLSVLRYTPALETNSAIAEFYSGPVEEAEKAIVLAQRFAAKTSALNGSTWADICSVQMSGDLGSKTIPENMRAQAAELMARGVALFNYESSDLTKVNLTGTDQNLELIITGDSEVRQILSRWVNLGSDNVSVLAIADLFKIYLIASSLNGSIDINLEGDDALLKIKITFSPLGDGVAKGTQDGDWLEEVIILFA